MKPEWTWMTTRMQSIDRKPGLEVPMVEDLWADGKKVETSHPQMTLKGFKLVQVVDLFCGGGGFSEGAKLAGAEVVLAIDSWPEALSVHHANHPDVKTMCLELGGSIVETAAWIRSHLNPAAHFHLHGSPPCQAISNASNVNSDEGMRLVGWFIDLAEYMEPDSWSMENVVPVAKKLDRLFPSIEYSKINCANLGLPQTRQRIIAGSGFTIKETHTQDQWVSVRDALPDLEGELEMTVNKNIKQRTLDEPFRTITSKVPSQTRIVSRRRKKNEPPQSFSLLQPSHTITRLPAVIERHIPEPPEVVRSMALEEAKILQGFPADYLIPYEKKKDAWVIVGNAVPPVLGRAIMEGLN